MHVDPLPSLGHRRCLTLPHYLSPLDHYFAPFFYNFLRRFLRLGMYMFMIYFSRCYFMLYNKHFVMMMVMMITTSPAVTSAGV